MKLDSKFWREFWPSFCATVAGVILSTILVLAVWLGQQWYVDRNDRSWTKENLISELNGDILKLRGLQDVIKQASDKEISLAQFFPFYLDTGIYYASVSSGNINLLSQRFQGQIHGAYSNFKKFNILLSSIESFANYNLSSPNFGQELKFRCDAVSRQASEYAFKAENTLKDLGGVIKNTDIPTYQIMTQTAPPPSGAKYAMLQLANDSDKSLDVSLRTKEGDVPQTYHLEPKSQTWAIIGLSDGKFQANTSSTDLKILLQGYIQ